MTTHRPEPGVTDGDIDEPPVLVLAVDDDVESFRAAGAVTRWFRDDARVVALHVAPVRRSMPATRAIDPTYESVAGYPWGYPSLFSSSSVETVDEGRDLAYRAAIIADGEARVEEGNPAAMITAVADSVDADVIVVGTGDRSWVSRLFDMSVSTHVVHHAPCSVLVVRDKDDEN